MKKFLLLLLLPLHILAQPREKVVETQVSEVTVYLRGAQITRTGRTALSAGVTELVFPSLANNIQPTSLQVSGEGNFTILSANFRVNYLRAQQNDPVTQMLEDSVEMLQYELEQLNNREFSFQQEVELILANKNFKGANEEVDAIDLEDMADFFRRRLEETRNLITEVKLRQKEVQEDLTRVRNQLGHRQGEGIPSGEVVVKVNAPAYSTASIVLTYYNPNAGWSPLYDLRAQGLRQPVKMDYKANVWQRTGIDWEDVALMLSTGNPSVNKTKPDLYTWYLNPYNPPPAPAARGAAKAEDQVVIEYAEPLVGESALYASNYTMMEENQLSTTFRISVPYTITSREEPQQVLIQQYQLPATYQYAAVPKLSSDAFLLAEVTGWEEYNLLPGEANLFFEGAYVGQSFINPDQVEDTLSLSLGRDKNIVIEREQIRTMEDEKFFGSKVEKEFIYQITVRNTKSQPIDIEVKDHLPVPQHKDIKLEVEELGGAERNVENGFLTWNLSIPAGEKKTVRYSYQVTYPQDMTLPGL